MQREQLHGCSEHHPESFDHLSQPLSRRPVKYVLITPARNEEAFIRRTLESVVAQSLLPERWVIVDDGSTDRTAEIVEPYTKQHAWIELVRRPQRKDRNFASKAHAVNAGLERVQSLSFEIVGNLDADVSFEPDYMEFLMQKFSEDPELGVAGTPFTQNGDYDSSKDSFEGENYVAGPCQLFRRECFQEIGGYVPNRAGGLDWIAVMTARMKGWKARAFPEKRFHHYRTLGTAEKGPLRAPFFLWGKRLLPGRLPSLAIIPRGISDGKETGFAGRTCPPNRLLLGGPAKSQPRCVSGVDVFSPKGADEKAQSDFRHPAQVQEGGQLSSCATESDTRL